jgi:Cdc6-like AAA superfamily ATPase
MTSTDAIRGEHETDDLTTAFTERLSKLTPRERPPELEADPFRAKELFSAAKVPTRHAGLENPTGAPWGDSFNAVKVKLGSGFIMALIGTRGTGKTQIACELIRENSKRNKTSRFTLAMDIFLAVRASYRKDAATDEAKVVEEFRKPRLLVIDEIQERAESQFEDRILTHILNHRYNDEKDTLLIGNIKAEEFNKAMGASIVSRLNETGGLITCDWPSYRQ